MKSNNNFPYYLLVTMFALALLFTSMAGAIGLVSTDIVPIHIGAVGAWAIGTGTGMLMKTIFQNPEGDNE